MQDNAIGTVKQGVPAPRAIVYCRVSTDEQAASGLGIEAQLHACALWAGREDRAIAGTFLDQGVSGIAPMDARPALVEALAALERGDVLVVAKRDRLGRDPIIVALIEREVTRQRCRVVSAAGEGTESDDPSNVLMRRIIDSFSEYERLVIKARTKAALAEKRRRGERTGQVPWGADLADDGRTLTPNAEELAIADMIADWAGHGISLRAIARELERTGVRTKSGGPWRHSSVASILSRAGARR